MNRSDLDDFLFASIGDEESGMTLSVVSALARLGVDPWREAARLAALPKPQAVAALAGLFEGLPRPVDPQRDGIGQATWLIGLLPAVPRTIPRSLRRRRWPLGFSGICLVLVLTALTVTLVNQAFFTQDQAPPAAFATRP